MFFLLQKTKAVGFFRSASSKIKEKRTSDVFLYTRVICWACDSLSEKYVVRYLSLWGVDRCVIVVTRIRSKKGNVTSACTLVYNKEYELERYAYWFIEDCR